MSAVRVLPGRPGLYRLGPSTTPISAADMEGNIMWRLRRYSFSIVLTLSIIGFSALYFLAPERSSMGAYVKSAAEPPSEQSMGPNSGSLPATVSVYSDPADAAVLIEDDTVGRTPLDTHRLPAGVYFITVAKNDYSEMDTVMALGNNDTAVYRPQLRPTYEGRRTSETRAARLPRPLPSEPVHPIQEQPAPAELVPEQIPTRETGGASSANSTDNAPVSASATGILTLSTDPGSTAVALNSKMVGLTPLRLDSIPSGTYEITFVRPGYETLTKQVEIRAGEEISLEASLDAQ